MKAPQNTNKPRPLCPIGLHLLRCVQVVDLGSQRFNGQDPSRKIYLGFETLEETHVFKDEEGPKPFMLQIEFAWYMRSNSDKKTKVRQFIEGWFDKSFPSEDDAANFDFSKLLGRLAGGLISHAVKKDGSKKAVIASLCPPDREKAKKTWEVVNRHICYEITDEEDGDFKYLPPFLQSKIRESDEFKGLTNQEPEPEMEEPDTTGSFDRNEPDMDETVPF